MRSLTSGCGSQGVKNTGPQQSLILFNLSPFGTGQGQHSHAQRSSRSKGSQEFESMPTSFPYASFVLYNLFRVGASWNPPKQRGTIFGRTWVQTPQGQTVVCLRKKLYPRCSALIGEGEGLDGDLHKLWAFVTNKLKWININLLLHQMLLLAH